MRGIKLGLWAIFTTTIIIIAVALVNQNSEPTAIALFSYVSEPLPKYLILIISFVLGALFSSLFFIIELIVLESRCLKLKRLNTKLERTLIKDGIITPGGANKVTPSDISISATDASDV